MFIELIDALRCIRAHEDSWLVGAFDEMRGRDVVTGTLGCPVCGASYPIVDGVARFGAATPVPLEGLVVHDTPEDALLLGALLDLTGGGGLVVLAGEWGAAAPALAKLLDEVQLLLVNPSSDALRAAEPSGASALIAPHAIPLASGTSRGVALGSATSSPPMLASAVRSLAIDGRLVAPATAPLPDGVTILARDEMRWVAERPASSGPLLPLRRARGPSGA